MGHERLEMLLLLENGHRPLYFDNSFDPDKAFVAIELLGDFAVVIVGVYVGG